MRTRLIWLGFLLVGQLANLLAMVWMLAAIAAGSKRARVIAVAYDQLANAATGGSGDETISSRANRARQKGKGWGCVLCSWLDWLDKDHCARSAGA